MEQVFYARRNYSLQAALYLNPARSQEKNLGSGDTKGDNHYFELRMFEGKFIVADWSKVCFNLIFEFFEMVFSTGKNLDNGRHY